MEQRRVDTTFQISGQTMSTRAFTKKERELKRLAKAAQASNVTEEILRVASQRRREHEERARHADIQAKNREADRQQGQN